MKLRHLLVRNLTVGFLILSTLCLKPSAVWAASLPALGNIDNTFPSGGSSNSINAGDPFDVIVSVNKYRVTDAGGQGANTTCIPHCEQGASYGGSLRTMTDIMMLN